MIFYPAFKYRFSRQIIDLFDNFFFMAFNFCLKLLLSAITIFRYVNRLSKSLSTAMIGHSLQITFKDKDGGLLLVPAILICIIFHYLVFKTRCLSVFIKMNNSIYIVITDELKISVDADIQ